MSLPVPPLARAFRRAAVALALVAVARAAAAQEPTLPERIGAPARAAIERIADSVRAAGAPAGPLYAKAAEGVLKGADDGRIVVAVRRLGRELTDARAALGAQAPEGDVIAAASALHAGVPASTLQRLRTARGGRGSLALPFTVLADLATRGAPPDVAAASLDTLLAHGAAESELTAFRAGVERDLLAGRDPRDALGVRTQNAVERLDAQPPRTGVQRPPRSATPPTP